MTIYKSTGTVEMFPQKGGGTYVRVPKRITKELQHRLDWGLIPIIATVGKTSWNTSLLPMGDGTHFIALNKKVRNKEHIELGKKVTVSFVLRG